MFSFVRSLMHAAESWRDRRRRRHDPQRPTGERDRAREPHEHTPRQHVSRRRRGRLRPSRRRRSGVRARRGSPSCPGSAHRRYRPRRLELLAARPEPFLGTRRGIDALLGPHGLQALLELLRTPRRAPRARRMRATSPRGVAGQRPDPPARRGDVVAERCRARRASWTTGTGHRSRSRVAPSGRRRTASRERASAVSRSDPALVRGQRLAERARSCVRPSRPAPAGHPRRRGARSPRARPGRVCRPRARRGRSPRRPASLRSDTHRTTRRRRRAPRAPDRARGRARRAARRSPARRSRPSARRRAGRARRARAARGRHRSPDR